MVNPTGPIFISYRWADGSSIAKDAARCLRASGVPVWLDRDDLPPGETATRLSEALASGIAGALLVATPMVALRKTPTDYIHDIEVPEILDNLAPAGAVIAVLNTIDNKVGKVDRGAPDRVYSRADASSYSQFSPIDGSLENMGRLLARERLVRLRPRRRNGVLGIDLQTRRSTTAFAAEGDLVFRTIPPEENRLPARRVWEDLAAFAAWLPDVIADERPSEVLLSGGAHLSLAFAVGAALPAPAGILVAVRATNGQTWRLPVSKRVRWWQRLRGSALSVRRLSWCGGGDALGVLVDLVPTPAAPTFIRHLEANSDLYHAGVIIRGNRTWADESGPRAVAEVATRVRKLAARYDSNVHLFLRTPWSAAALLGTLLNTVRSTLYEWDNSAAESRYVKTISVVPGLSQPVTEIHVPTTSP